MKKIISTVAGVISGGIIVFIVEMMAHKIYPLPEGIDLSDEASMKLVMEYAPVGALLLVLLAWLLGAFVGGVVTSLLLSAELRQRQALTVGAIFLALDLSNLITFPHPWWMWVGAFIGSIPVAYAGYILVSKLKSN